VACAAGTTSNAGSSECDDGCDAGSYLDGYDCFYCPSGQVNSCTPSCHEKYASVEKINNSTLNLGFLVCV
jgi:hypothetical protein